MCSRERGGLWCIKNHLREGQTKTVTRKSEFVLEILFVCNGTVPALAGYVGVGAYKRN